MQVPYCPTTVFNPVYSNRVFRAHRPVFDDRAFWHDRPWFWFFLYSGRSGIEIYILFPLFLLAENYWIFIPWKYQIGKSTSYWWYRPLAYHGSGNNFIGERMVIHRWLTRKEFYWSTNDDSAVTQLWLRNRVIHDESSVIHDESSGGYISRREVVKSAINFQKPPSTVRNSASLNSEFCCIIAWSSLLIFLIISINSLFNEFRHHRESSRQASLRITGEAANAAVAYLHKPDPQHWSAETDICREGCGYQRTRVLLDH